MHTHTCTQTAHTLHSNAANSPEVDGAVDGCSHHTEGQLHTRCRVQQGTPVAPFCQATKHSSHVASWCMTAQKGQRTKGPVDKVPWTSPTPSGTGLWAGTWAGGPPAVATGSLLPSSGEGSQDTWLGCGGGCPKPHPRTLMFPPCIRLPPLAASCSESPLLHRLVYIPQSPAWNCPSSVKLVCHPGQWLSPGYAGLPRTGILGGTISGFQAVLPTPWRRGWRVSSPEQAMASGWQGGSFCWGSPQSP